MWCATRRGFDYRKISQNFTHVLVSSKATQFKTRKTVEILQQTRHEQVDVRMPSHGLQQLVASCYQTCYKFIVKTCYPQACCKLFQQVVTSLQMTSCDKPDFNTLIITCVCRAQSNFITLFTHDIQRYTVSVLILTDRDVQSQQCSPSSIVFCFLFCISVAIAEKSFR